MLVVDRLTRGKDLGFDAVHRLAPREDGEHITQTEAKWTDAIAAIKRRGRSASFSAFGWMRLPRSDFARIASLRRFKSDRKFGTYLDPSHWRLPKEKNPSDTSSRTVAGY
jgi:hypothetical protein